MDDRRGTTLEEGDHIETLLSAIEDKTIRETAGRWGCSERAVAKRRAALVTWLGARHMIHAVALAYQRGILHSKSK